MAAEDPRSCSACAALRHSRVQIRADRSTLPAQACTGRGTPRRKDAKHSLARRRVKGPLGSATRHEPRPWNQPHEDPRAPRVHCQRPAYHCSSGSLHRRTDHCLNDPTNLANSVRHSVPRTRFRCVATHTAGLAPPGPCSRRARCRRLLWTRCCARP